MIDFGNRLRKLRANKNITQQSLAERLDVTKSVISAYENSVRYPSYDILIKISGIFGVSTDYLLGCSQNNTIDVSGLNENEIEGIVHLVTSLKKSHNQ